MAPTILIVDDDGDLGDLISYIVERAGYAPTAVQTVAQAKQAIDRSLPDLVILDVNLPDGDGMAVLTHLQSLVPVPVLVLSVGGSEADVIRFLNANADDYLTKPFRPRELEARVRALLRRYGLASSRQRGDAPPGVVVAGGLRIDVNRHVVTLDRQPLRLSPTEFRLLHILAANHDHVLSSDVIISLVWGHDFDSESATDLVRVTIARLRRKLSQHHAGEGMIQTVSGVGYVLRAPRDGGR